MLDYRGVFNSVVSENLLLLKYIKIIFLLIY